MLVPSLSGFKPPLLVWSFWNQNMNFTKVTESSSGKEPICQCRLDIRDAGLIPGSARSPGGEKSTHCSTLAWRIPWTEDPGGLQSRGSQRGRHDSSDLAYTPSDLKVYFGVINHWDRTWSKWKYFSKSEHTEEHKTLEMCHGNVSDYDRFLSM